MKKAITALISFLVLVFSLLLQSCHPASGDNFDVLSLEVTPVKVIENEQFTVTASISNPSNSEVNFNVPVIVDGIVADRTSVILAPGKSQEVQFKLRKSEAGRYEIKIGDKTVAVFVEKVAPAQLKLSDLKINRAELNPGEEVVITACLSNIGGTKGEYVIELMINGVAEQADRVTLPAGAKYNCVFKLTKSEPGTYGVAIGDLSGKFTVVKAVETIQFTTPIPEVQKRFTQRSACCPGGSGSGCE